MNGQDADWIWISSGGTREPIDEVRYIGNHSTGRTGCSIASEFLARGYRVRLMVGRGAKRPSPHPRLLIEEFESTDSLIGLFTQGRDDASEPRAIIHAAAVADYRPEPLAGKLSSDPETLTLLLRKTPKIVHSLKEWFPQSCLIQFKLLVNVSKEELWEASKRGLMASGGDFCIANDLRNLEGGEGPRAWLISRAEEPIPIESETDLATMLVSLVERP